MPVTTNWSYDADGNRLWQNDVYDAQDRQTSHDSITSQTYGNNGEIATRQAPGSTLTYKYDSLGNLKHFNGIRK